MPLRGCIAARESGECRWRDCITALQMKRRWKRRPRKFTES
ncbi:MAG: hypothetical protein Q4A17_10635 [Thermoguttaceae bacterium]|nr:hypothetical protein [Thermoguttaceae bacterium]